MTESHILLVRHPQTQANVEGRFVGRGSSAYTREGHRQLARIPRKVARFAPDAVWTSPLERAHRLAAASAKVAAVPLHVDDRLVEIDFGDAEGKTYAEIAEAGMHFDYRDRERPVAPGGESRGEVERRAAEFCDELLGHGGRQAVVTHGGVFRASLVHLLGLSTTGIWAFDIRNAQLAMVHVVDGHGMLQEFVLG